MTILSSDPNLIPPQPSQPINSSTVGVADLYAGERWIPELGLYDLRNRFMSPEWGRFLQPDPIGFKGDASNLYRYCHNDPEDFSDPTGLISWNAGPLLTSWGNGDWRTDDGGFNGDLVEAYQQIRDAIKSFFSGSKQTNERSEKGNLTVQSSNVELTHKTLGYHKASDKRGGYTPNPLETKGGVGVTSVQTGPGNLSLTYH